MRSPVAASLPFVCTSCVADDTKSISADVAALRAEVSTLRRQMDARSAAQHETDSLMAVLATPLATDTSVIVDTAAQAAHAIACLDDAFTAPMRFETAAPRTSAPPVVVDAPARAALVVVDTPPAPRTSARVATRRRRRRRHVHASEALRVLDVRLVDAGRARLAAERTHGVPYLVKLTLATTLFTRRIDAQLEVTPAGRVEYYDVVAATTTCSDVRAALQNVVESAHLGDDAVASVTTATYDELVEQCIEALARAAIVRVERAADGTTYEPVALAQQSMDAYVMRIASAELSAPPTLMRVAPPSPVRAAPPSPVRAASAPPSRVCHAMDAFAVREPVRAMDAFAVREPVRATKMRRRESPAKKRVRVAATAVVAAADVIKRGVAALHADVDRLCATVPNTYGFCDIMIALDRRLTALETDERVLAAERACDAVTGMSSVDDANLL